MQVNAWHFVATGAGWLANEAGQLVKAWLKKKEDSRNEIHVYLHVEEKKDASIVSTES